MSTQGPAGVCLFTGEQLRADNLIEHAPPRTLGGRYASRDTTSSSFNNASGTVLDQDLVECWRQLLTYLAPAMSSDHRSTKGVDIKVGGVPHVIAPGGTVMLKHARVLRGDGTNGPLGRPIKVTAADPRTVRAIADANNFRNRELVLSLPELDENVEQDALRPVLTPEHDVAALKSILVAFDIAHGSASDSWVRSSYTERARRLVLETVETRTAPHGPCADLAWGRDPALAPRIMDLVRPRIADLHALDHVFVACGDNTRRVLDATWVAFGHEPVSFRLSTEYRGPDFCEALCCSPLRDGHPSPLVSLSRQFILPRERGSVAVHRADQDPRLDLALVNAQLGFARAVGHAAVLGELAKSEMETADILYRWAYRHRSRNDVKSAHDVVVTMAIADYRRPSGRVRAVAEAAVRERAPALATRTVSFEQAPRMGVTEAWAIEAAPTYKAVLQLLYEQLGPPPKLMVTMEAESV